MSLLFIPLTPLIGILLITLTKDLSLTLDNQKYIALGTSIITFIVSLLYFILFDFSTNIFQFVVENYKISYFDFFLGIDGLSVYFVLLTTLIIPGSLLSNWKSIKFNVEVYLINLLLLETLLLMVFIVLDVFLFYILFESILPPLFILVGMFGSENRIRAGFYLFLYTLLGSLFLLLSILSMSSTMCITDYDSLFKKNFKYVLQLFLFYGIFIAFAVKTPTMFLNTWLLKAHVESPLGGSIILAAIVLKLSLYGIFRLILAVLVKAFMVCTYIIFLIGVITIIYASLSTLRTIDVKELIAYSSVSHAAVYLMGAFGNCVQGIVGSISLGFAHGLVSPGLFICAGGILYDRAHTRLIALYRGMTQLMPLFAIVFFIFCLANCGVPLTLNFVGEFMSLFGVFVRSLIYGVFGSLSIVFSAAYSMVLYQKIAFGGSYSQMFKTNIEDVVSREFSLVMPLVILTVLLGIYPAVIMDAVSYEASGLIFNSIAILCDAPRDLEWYAQDSVSLNSTVCVLSIVATIMCATRKFYKYPIKDIDLILYTLTQWFINITLPCICILTSLCGLLSLGDLTNTLSVLEVYPWYLSYDPNLLTIGEDFGPFNTGPVQDGYIFCSTPDNNGIHEGVAADQENDRRIGECTHDRRGEVTVTEDEFQRGNVPDCDFNPTFDPQGGQTKHPAANAPGETFVSCLDCHAVICGGCNTA